MPRSNQSGIIFPSPQEGTKRNCFVPLGQGNSKRSKDGRELDYLISDQSQKKDESFFVFSPSFSYHQSQNPTQKVICEEDDVGLGSPKSPKRTTFLRL